MAQQQGLNTPPHDLPMEASLLGAMLLDNGTIDTAAQKLKADDFYSTRHRTIYKHILGMHLEGEAVDIVTLLSRLNTSGDLHGAGGRDYLVDLLDSVPAVANAEHYAGSVKEMAVRRNGIVAGYELVRALQNGGTPTREVLSSHEETICNLAITGNTKIVTLKETLYEVMNNLGRARQGELPGIATQYRDLDTLLGGLQPGRLYVLAGRPSMGKAQPLSAKIKTVSGWKCMGEIQVGDSLASHDGRNSKVVKVHPRGERTLFKITFSDGRTTECCEEHLWRVYCRKWSTPKTLNTKQIITLLSHTRYKNRLRLDLVSGDFGGKAALPLDPWILGVLLGDGDLTQATPRFSTPDAEILQQMKRRLGSNFMISSSARSEYEYRICTTGGPHKKGVNGSIPNRITTILKSLGLWGTKSNTKFIPKEYLVASRESRLNLLRGLIDTDGWVEKSGSIRFSSNSRQLALDVQALVRSLGGLCRIKVKEITSYNYVNTPKEPPLHYVCKIRHCEGRELVSLLKKKTRVPNPPLRKPRLNFESIEVSRTAETRCLTVSHPDGLYITDDYIVTHNSAFAWNLITRIGINQHIPTLVFTLEVSASECVTNVLVQKSRVDGWRIIKANLHDHHWLDLTNAAEAIAEAPVYLLDTAGLGISEVLSHGRHAKTKYGIGFIVVDYLQLMDAQGRESREQAVAAMSKGLKRLARELEVPVLAVSQLNRGVEYRENKRPLMSDLRESGSIEQDADVVILMYRDDYYHPDSHDKGIVELNVAKHRGGPTGMVKCLFIKDYLRFEDLTKEPAACV